MCVVNRLPTVLMSDSSSRSNIDLPGTLTVVFRLVLTYAVVSGASGVDG